MVGGDADFACLFGLSRIALGGENCDVTGDNADLSCVLGRSTIEAFMVEKKAGN
jgi:hypothetical protein